MKVWIADQAYVVTWEYREIKPATKTHFGSVETTCHIRAVGDLEYSYSASVVQWVYDPFSKETARRESLTKVLEPFDRETRKVFWQAYWERGL